MEGRGGKGRKNDGEKEQKREEQDRDTEEREGCVWWTGVGAGRACAVIQATLLLLACHNPRPWLPATATPRAGLVLECKWLRLAGFPLPEEKKLLTKVPGISEFFQHRNKKHTHTNNSYHKPGIVAWDGKIP